MKIVGLGAGGHAKVIIDILSHYSEYQIVGLTSPEPERIGQHVLGIPILGNDDLLPQLRVEGVTGVFIGVGSISNCELRRKLFNLAVELDFDVIHAKHPTAVIAQSVEMGAGVAIMAQVAINPATRIEHNVIVNTGAQVDHDCCIGQHTHIAPGAHIAGGVKIGPCSHVGIGATIIQEINIGQNVIVGAGAVVLKDIPSGATAIGSPARIIRQTKIDP